MGIFAKQKLQNSICKHSNTPLSRVPKYKVNALIHETMTWQSPTCKGYQINSSTDSVADIYGGCKIKVHNRDKIKIKASQVFITWLKT